MFIKSINTITVDAAGNVHGMRNTGDKPIDCKNCKWLKRDTQRRRVRGNTVFYNAGSDNFTCTRESIVGMHITDQGMFCTGYEERDEATDDGTAAASPG